MARKTLGSADITAYRIGGVTNLAASGTFANFNDKADFEQLPFDTHPPIWAFYVLSPGISLPATRPFAYSEPIAFPVDAKEIRVQSAAGIQAVPIVDIAFPTTPPDAKTGAHVGNFSVYKWIGLNTLMIAPADAMVPAVYTKVFGPASYEECKKYIADNPSV